MNSSKGCGDGITGCHPHSSVWSFLTHSDQFVPEYMQATSGVRYELSGRTFRFANFVTDGGRPLSNGMASTVAARQQNWYDADGSAAGWVGSPTIIGSAVSEAGSWFRRAPLMCNLKIHTHAHTHTVREREREASTNPS